MVHDAFDDEYQRVLEDVGGHRSPWRALFLVRIAPQPDGRFVPWVIEPKALGATIYFADEASVRSDYHSGTPGSTVRGVSR